MRIGNIQHVHAQAGYLFLNSPIFCVSARLAAKRCLLESREPREPGHRDDQERKGQTAKHLYTPLQGGQYVLVYDLPNSTNWNNHPKLLEKVFFCAAIIQSRAKKFLFQTCPSSDIPRTIIPDSIPRNRKCEEKTN